MGSLPISDLANAYLPPEAGGCGGQVTEDRLSGYQGIRGEGRS